MSRSIEQLKRDRKHYLDNPSVPEIVARFCLNSLHKHEWYHTQVIFGFYILDFVIPSKMLIIEIDGSQHKENKIHDSRRDKFCNELGFRVCRIPAGEAHTILKYLEKYKDVSGYKSRYSNALTQASKMKQLSEKHSYLK